MNSYHKLIAAAVMLAGGLGTGLLASTNVADPHLGRTLYSFAGGSDGDSPNGSLIVDALGTYYGTTSYGGGGSNCSSGCGTVYKVANGQESAIYRFLGGSDGANPVDGLLLDDEGNLYGATFAGGASGFGTVFKIAPDGSETILHSFTGGTDDGASPNGDLIADAEGNLYGTTHSGGSGTCDGGCGTVFKITPDGQESVIHFFHGGAEEEGRNPSGGLVADAEGNFYGTTYGGGGVGGCGVNGCGTIFKITPDGETTLIHKFGFSRGGHPNDRLLIDAEGNFYGTGGRKFGTVWKVSSDGATDTILYAFQKHADGALPGPGLVADAEGNLFGTTLSGGANGNGVIWRLSAEGRIATLYDFPGSNAGDNPYGRLLIDQQGNLIGTTLDGGDHGLGTIFQVKN